MGAALLVLDADASSAGADGADDRRPRGGGWDVASGAAAVIDEQGFQCAFCMPGFVMNMVALVEANPTATRAEAAQHLSGNLCRCATTTRS